VTEALEDAQEEMEKIAEKKQPDTSGEQG